MIYIVGDLHGNFMCLATLKEHLTPEDTVIQVGDFGFYPETIKEWMHLFEEYPCRILAIDGNHEDFNYLDTFDGELPEIAPNLFRVSRGTVMEIEGKLFGFLGGGESVDKAFRKENVSWWKQERVTDKDLQKLIENVNYRTLDFLITHVPPKFVVTAEFGPFDLEYWQLPNNWVDISSEQISKIYHTLQPRNLLCGHMHRSVIHGNIRIVDINEVITI